MMNFLTKPWLHFSVLGVCLYALQQWQQGPDIVYIAPPTALDIAQLRGQWLRTTGRIPSTEQVRTLIDNDINQNILFQEALQREWHLTDTVVRGRLLRNIRFLDTETMASDERLIKSAIAMSLHENDPVVRRRLIQRMEMLAYAPVHQSQPNAEQLQQRYQQAQRMTAARVQFRHIFISRDQHTNPVAQANTILQQLSAGANAARLSDPFLHGLEFQWLSEQQVSRYFGVAFANNLLALCKQPQPVTRQWQGPASSSYGEHLLWIEGCEAARPKTLAEVKSQLVAEWRREQKKGALQALLTKLKQRYHVEQIVAVATDV